MKANIKYVSAVIIHFVLGFLIYLNEDLAKVYFFGILIYFLGNVFYAEASKKTFEILKACAYFVGAEVLFRTTHGAISYEAGKYMVILFVVIGMFFKGASGKGYPYFMYLMFLVPSIFVASTVLRFDANFRTNIAFVLSGPVCLGLAALFCYGKRVSFNQMSSILLFILLPIVAHTAYVYFYAPDLRDILTSTASNREAAGGFGSNQVATMLGLGMFIVGVRLFINSPSLVIRIFNMILLVFISNRAVVTLSRGGVITGILCIIVFMIYYFAQSNGKVKNRILSVCLLIIGTLIVAWVVSSDQTRGLSEKRYANQNAMGVQKKDFTTGRKDLFLGEIAGFISNPFFGIGSSRAKDERIEKEGQGITSHNEISRTLAEHGIFGIMILVILIFKPIDIRVTNRKNYYFYGLLAFWFATINHSSMRIAAPAFIYALALLNVTNEKPSIRRKLSAK